MAKQFLNKILKFAGRAILIASIATTGLSANSSAQTTYVDRFTGSVVATLGKQPVDAATTSAITLSGYQTVDGVNLNQDYMRCLVKNQTDVTTNGIYVVTSGAWFRAGDFSGPSGVVSGQIVYDTGGTQAGFFVLTTPNPIQVDQSGGQSTNPSNITFSPYSFFQPVASSTTTNTIATGTKNFTTNTGLNLAVGQYVQAIATGSPSNYMIGQVTAYTPSTGALALNITNIGGSGSFSAWNIYQSGAVGPVPSFAGTSTTSQTPATGSLTFTTQAGLSFSVGQFVSAISSGTPTAYIVGNITSYSGTSLVVNSQVFNGTGAHTDWNISLAGVPGANGSSIVPWAAAAGTANAITGAFNPTVTSLTDGLLLGFRAGSANTSTTPTFQANSTTAHTITALGGQALAVGNITGNNAEYLIRYNLANTRWELLNPTTIINAATTSTLGLVSTDGATISNSGGAISARTATGSVTGVSKPDGTTITISGGVLSAAQLPIITPIGVGSIVTAAYPSSTIAIGGQVSGSSLITCVIELIGASTGCDPTGDTLSGTWQALVTYSNNGNHYVILWQRVSWLYQQPENLNFA